MNELIRIIEEQQKGKENTAVFMVGEQLKEIAEREPCVVDLLVRDLQIPEMSLEAAEKKIKEYSDKNKKGATCFCVSPKVAEDILRKFYGLPDGADDVKKESAPASSYIDLDSFL